MKKAPSAILAAAGITVGLLGFALPASAAVPGTQPHMNSGTHGKTTSSNNNNKNKNKKQSPPHNCQPPQGQKHRGGKQHQSTGAQPPALAESQNQPAKTTGQATPIQWQQPKKVIACHPAPAPQQGKGKKNPKPPKGYPVPETNNNNSNKNGNRP